MTFGENDELVLPGRWNENSLSRAVPPGTYVLWLALDVTPDAIIKPRRLNEESSVVSAKGRGLTAFPIDLSVAVSFVDAPPAPVTCNFPKVDNPKLTFIPKVDSSPNHERDCTNTNTGGVR